MGISGLQNMLINGTDLPKAQVEQILSEEQSKSFESTIQKAVESKDQVALKKATEEFEAVFIQILLKTMRSTVQEGGLVEKSQGRSMFEGMYDEELAKKMAEGRQMGIADMLYQQLSKFTDQKKGFDRMG